MTTTPFQISRSGYGHLVLTAQDGQVYEQVNPVRAFPIQAPERGISLVLPDGKEVAWIETLSEVAEPARSLIAEELEGREFMPEIQQIIGVTSFATPCTWHVKTDRGDTEFVLKGDEDIRRIGAASLLITDNHGIHFLIRDLYGIDKHSRKILDRFM